MRYLLICLIFSSCALIEEPVEMTKAGKLPLLKKQNNIGSILGFNPSYPDATLDSFDVAWSTLLEAGMSVGRLQIDWEELEPTEDEYDKVLLEDALIKLQADGLQPLMTFTVYDSEGPGLPGYLEGNRLDSERVLTRFKKLMDWMIPMLVQYDSWGIIIANEPDNFFAEDKELEEEIIAYTSEARDHIHGINDEIGVTVTMNIENLDGAKKATKSLLNECDFLSINLYGSGLFPLDQPFTAQENEENFEEILDFANGKQIVVQELGMHANRALLNSSEDIQAAFFEQFFEFMEREEQVRAAVQFTMVDWSQEVVEFFNSTYEPETPQWFIDQYGSVLKSLGLIEFETGRKRLAFQTFEKWCSKF